MASETEFSKYSTHFDIRWTDYINILQIFISWFPSWMLWRCCRSSSRTLLTVSRQFRENTARCSQTDRLWTASSTRIDRWGWEDKERHDHDQSCKELSPDWYIFFYCTQIVFFTYKSYKKESTLTRVFACYAHGPKVLVRVFKIC